MAAQALFSTHGADCSFSTCQVCSQIAAPAEWQTSGCQATPATSHGRSAHGCCSGVAVRHLNPWACNLNFDPATLAQRGGG